jgi:hypothetical protein
MAEILKISDLTEGKFLAFDLHDLVALIPSEGERLTWCVFPMGESLEVSGDGFPYGLTAEEFGRRVDASGSGVPLPWEGLLALALSIHQTIWGLFLGCQKAEVFTEIGAMFDDDWRYLDRASPAFYDAIDIAFQAVDSSFWLVSAKDPTVRERIRNAFRDEEVIATV